MTVDYQNKLILSLNEERLEEARLVIVHPHSKRRGMFTSTIVERFGSDLYYYAAQNEPSLANFVRNMIGAFAEAIEDFGGKTRAALDTDGSNAEALAQALVDDLTQQPGGPYALWLDELDRARLNDDFMNFFKHFAGLLPAGAQLVLCTRQMPHHPWRALFDVEELVILDDSKHPIQSKEDKPLLEVFALGAGHALIDGEPILSWDGALPRNLFFFFVDRPLVTRDEVFVTFWPDLSVKEATNVFHVTKRKISERLDHELTSYNSGFYIPSGQMEVYYDAVDFLESIEQAATMDDAAAADLYLHAVNLYRGDFLSGLDMEWAAERRMSLKGAYAQALIALGRIGKKRSRDEEALGYFIRALHETPEREDIHREVMSLYVKLGQPEAAKAQYRRLEAELEEDLGITPSRASRELFESIVA